MDFPVEQSGAGGDSGRLAYFCGWGTAWDEDVVSGFFSNAGDVQALLLQVASSSLLSGDT